MGRSREDSQRRNYAAEETAEVYLLVGVGLCRASTPFSAVNPVELTAL